MSRRGTFRPSEEALEAYGLSNERHIQVLVVDESGPGVELRIWNDGALESLPLTQGVDHYRNSPLWEEVVDEA